MTTTSTSSPHTARDLALKIEARLAAVRSRLRLLLMAEGVAVIVLAAVAAAFGSYVLDRGLTLAWSSRAAGLAIAAAGVGVLIWRMLLTRSWIELPDEELALLVERRHPGLAARLVSALQLGRSAPTGASAELVDAFSAEEGPTLLALNPVDDVAPGRALGWGGGGAAALLLAIGLASGYPDEATIWAQRNLMLRSDVLWPRATRFIVEGFTYACAGCEYVHAAFDAGERFPCHGCDAIVEVDPERTATTRRIPKGDDATLVIDAIGRFPPHARVLYEFEESGASGHAEVGAIVPGRYSHKLTGLTEPVTVWIDGGDADRIGPYRIEVEARPWIEELGVTITPPAYTGLGEDVREDPPGELAVPAGSRIALTGRASKRLRKAWVDITTTEAPKRLEATLGGEDGRSFSASFGVGEGVEVAIGAKDGWHLEPERVPRLRFDALPDTAPEVELAVQNVSDIVTAVAEFPLEVSGKDDYGLAGGVLAFTLAPPDEEVEPTTERVAFEEVVAGEKKFAATRTWSLAALAPEPGTFLSFQAEATDQRDIEGGPNTGRSQVFSVRVVTREEFLAAMLQRQQAEAREFEKIVAGEERLEALLAVIDPEGDDAAAADQPDPGALARSQMGLARRTGGVADRLERLVAEMHANGVADDFGGGEEEGEENRLDLLEKEVIAPLRALERRQLPGVSASLDRLAAGTGEHAESTRLLAEALGQMRKILTRMARHETLAEVITKLEALLRTEREVIRETEKVRKGTGLEPGGDGR